jgi:haloacetate dehalogenase
MFDGFTLQKVDVGGATLRVRHGGSGAPIVLLHGHPRTHTTWWRVAPELAETHTVVCPDLRGYGQSSKPESDAEHTPYSKRAMAADIVALMGELGHERFSVVGHDRGSYVALRLALDHPRVVDRLVLLDCVPIGEALARADARFASQWWHWFFLGQTEKPAERLINADPLGWYRGHADAMGRENYEDYLKAIRDPQTVHAMCEDYRAGLTVDRAADDADRVAGVKVQSPTLVLWSERDDLFELYGDQLSLWREWASDVTVGSIDSGHHVAEEAPEELVRRILEFLRR